MVKCLVTGGAGFVGSTLNGYLLSKGHHVTVVDNLLFNNGNSLSFYFKNPNFRFVKGNVCDKSLMKSILKDKDIIIHLAAIVGAPACERNRDLAISVNLDATINMCELLSKDQRILFASTGSNYGAVTGDICTEETLLNPISLYGETKTDGEKWLLDHSNAVAYRFATAFGLSLRMRLDLLINDFVYQAINNRYLIMFERSFKRSFIHVDDMARSFLFAIENHDKVESGAYNIGDEQNNYSKEEIALLIKDKVDYYLHFADVGEDKDKRNYEVSYSKFKSLGFKAETSVEDGIDQLIKSMEAFEFIHPYRNA